MKTIIMSVLVWIAITVGAMAQPDYGIMIFNHEIAIGMTFANVVAAWGNPVNVDRTYSSHGVTEYWFMKSNWMVVFENGQVTSFHQYGGGL
jgi:hypothetical protein